MLERGIYKPKTMNWKSARRHNQRRLQSLSGEEMQGNQSNKASLASDFGVEDREHSPILGYLIPMPNVIKEKTCKNVTKWMNKKKRDSTIWEFWKLN